MSHPPPSQPSSTSPQEIPLKETPKELLDHLALRFQKYRLAANIPQETLAKAAGVGIATLRRFESGGNLSARALLTLLRELGCPLDPTRLIRLKQTPDHTKDRQRARKIQKPRTPPAQVQMGPSQEPPKKPSGGAPLKTAEPYAGDGI